MDLHPNQARRAHDDRPDYIADRLSAAASPGSSFAACIAIGLILAGASSWLDRTRPAAEPSAVARGTPAIHPASRDIAIRSPESFDLHIEHASKMRMMANDPRAAHAYLSNDGKIGKL